MKNLIVAGALALGLVAGPLHAGGMSAPIVEAEVIAEEAAATSDHGILVPILALIFFAAALSSGGNGLPPS